MTCNRRLPEIKGFRENTLLDWEGQIASILFLPGCNFRCPYCHASALVIDPAQIDPLPIEKVDEYLDNNRGWIDGVVISGGEATLHPELPDLIDHLRARGVKIKLFSNGTRPDVIRNLIDTDRLAAIAMDLKAPLDERYERAAGVSVDLQTIQESIELLKNSGVDYEFRTTVCPTIIDHDDVMAAAQAIAGARRLVLQQFRPVDCLDPAFEQIRPYSIEKLDQMAEAAEKFVERCVVSK